MRHQSLARTFHRLVLLSLPMPAAVLGAACSGTVTDNSGTSDRVTATGGAALDAGTIVTSCGERVPSTLLFPGCPAPVCFPIEAGAFDAAAAEASNPDASPTLGPNPMCTALCGSVGFLTCAPATVNGVSMVRCNPDCTGRRPEGLLPSLPATGTLLGAYFAEMARLECASIDAFRQLRDELVRYGAPRALVRGAERAARDEIRHTRATLALARRYGGQWRAPVVVRGPLRGLEAIATDNAVEGCVRETFGALVATFQAHAARDPVIRAAMERIARDETRHAALAQSIDAWIATRLDRAARWRVEQARHDATAALLASLEEPGLSGREALGLPTAVEARRLATAMTAALAA